jgi:DNA-binding response OmpR family regulator
MHKDAAAKARTILVVEDEVLIRMAVADYLRECGYRVLEASNAAEAIKLLDAQPVDLVFTDVDMPGEMDGFGLAHWVRDHAPGIPVIITSGVPRTAGKAEELCKDGPLLDKPYHHQGLSVRINALLASTRQRHRQQSEAG